MQKLRFFAVPSSTELYEVDVDGKNIGIVGRSGEQWHADPSNMAAPEITESSREVAAEKLISAT